MKDYELTVVVHPDLEMNPDPAIAKVKKLIEANGGTITKEEVEGKKRLAYPINGHTFALYYYADVELPSDAPDKISTSMNINDEIIRYLLVRTDPRKAKYAAIRAESGQDEAASDEDQANNDTINQEEDK